LAAIANTKTAKKGVRTKNHDARGASMTPLTRLHRDVAGVAAKYPPLGQAQLAAFGSLCSDAKADDLGGRTRAPTVRDTAAKWMLDIDKALGRYPGALAGYVPVRFAYFLDTLGRLATAIELDRGRAATVSDARGGVDAEESAAAALRAGAVDRLKTFAGDRAAPRQALATASRRSDDDKTGAGVLRSLAQLELAWCKPKGAADAILAAAAGLSEEKAAELTAAADRLEDAGSGARTAGSARANDSPEVNRVEGQMLFEMREARRLFAAAKRRNHVIPALVVPRALYAVFGLGKNGAAADGAEGDAPAPANPA
jgi:hypothetical protein